MIYNKDIIIIYTWYIIIINFVYAEKYIYKN